MEKLEVFQTLKPQGIKGELKVKILADDFSSVKGIKTLFGTDGKTYTVNYIKDVTGGFAFLSLNEVKDRNMAETMRGVDFSCEKKDIKKSKNSHFIVDLIGLKVYKGKEEFATVKNVITGGNVDMFEVLTLDNKTAYFPHLKKLNPTVDLEKGTLTVDETELDGVIFYES